MTDGHKISLLQQNAATQAGAWVKVFIGVALTTQALRPISLTDYDRLVAQSILDDLQNALRGTP